MGCVNCKCCGKFPSSSSDDNRDAHELLMGNKEDLVTASEPLEIVPIPSHDLILEYSVLSQRGYYPDTPHKENQDCYCIKTHVRGDPNVHFFGVFDGHGQSGTQCANFAKDRLIEILCSDDGLLEDPAAAFTSAFATTNLELHASEVIDDAMSGTTAIVALVIGDRLFVANVGDSRAVIAVKGEGDDRVVAVDLSTDQTPFRKDEYDRVKLCGARVLSVDQLEGIKDPSIQTWGDEEGGGSDPPRLWVPNGMYPGTAFTRSIGDRLAENIGVVAVPEVKEVQLTADNPLFVLASDGVFEFLSSQAVVNMANIYADPGDACAAITRESYRLWLEQENRTDDITIIVVRVKSLSDIFDLFEVKQNGVIDFGDFVRALNVMDGTGFIEHQ
ncbi:hypothetical protein OSB04_030013, partial [Centaurea solstitialis]